MLAKSWPNFHRGPQKTYECIPPLPAGYLAGPRPSSSNRLGDPRGKPQERKKLTSQSRYQRGPPQLGGARFQKFGGSTSPASFANLRRKEDAPRSSLLRPVHGGRGNETLPASRPGFFSFQRFNRPHPRLWLLWSCSTRGAKRSGLAPHRSSSAPSGQVGPTAPGRGSSLLIDERPHPVGHKTPRAGKPTLFSAGCPPDAYPNSCRPPCVSYGTRARESEREGLSVG